MSEALPLLLVLLPLVGSILLALLPASPARLRDFACVVAFASASLCAFALQSDADFAFRASWFRFQNLEVAFDFALPAQALRPGVLFLGLAGLIACAIMPLADGEAPRLQLSACLLWTGLGNATAMAGDVLVLVICFEAHAIAWALALVTRRRKDAVASATALMVPSAIGGAALLAFAVHATVTPLPVDGVLELSASLDAARAVEAPSPSVANWLLLAAALACLPRAILWPAQGAWTQLQHRVTPSGAVLGTVGGLALSVWVFSMLTASYARDASAWGHPAVAWIFCLGMLGLGVVANLRESVRRRCSAALMAPLCAIPLGLYAGDARGFALASVAVLALGLPVCTLLQLVFAFAKRREPGRLRELRGAARAMPRFGLLFAIALALVFGVPGSAADAVLSGIAERVHSEHVALWITGSLGFLASSLALLVVLLVALGRSEDARRPRDLSLAEFCFAALPLLLAIGLAFFVGDILDAQESAFRALGLPGGGG